MDRLTSLYDIGEKENIYMAYFDLAGLDGACMKVGHQYGIALDKSRFACPGEEACLLAHELGHYFTGTYYMVQADRIIKQKGEYKADRWAVRQLIPFDRLMDAFESGRREIWSLAEYFDVPESFMRRAIEVYVRAGTMI